MKERELPEGWEWKRLEEIAEINSRFDKNSFDDETDVTFLPMKCVEELTGRMDTSIEKKYGEIKTGYTPIQEGDLLFAKITPCIENGKIAIAQNLKNRIGFASTEFHTLKFSPDNETKFYFFFLMQEKIRQEAARNMTGTAGQQRVPVTFLKRLEVPVPPLPIQRQIVAVLEQVEAVKRKRQEADAQTGALLQSVFYEMFGDPVSNERGYPIKSLRELCHNITDGKHGDCTNLENSEYYFISAKDIINGKIDYTNSRQITREDYLEVNKRLKFEIGDILITNSGSIGKIAIAEDIEKTPRTTFQKSVAIIKSDKKLIESKYLVSILDLNKNELNKQSAGSSQKNLLLRDINNFKIPLPPLALQQQFARVVESVERIRERQSASGRQIEGLCEGLMQRAFAGELVA